MVTAVSTPTLAVPTLPAKDADSVTVNAVKVADAALHSILENEEVLKSLGDQSSQWVPASRGKVMATLWGMFNLSGSSLITKEDVRRAVIAQGGGTSAADALWARLDPEKRGAVSAGDFAVNEYLTGAITTNLTSIQKAVEEMRREQALLAPKSGSLFDFYTGGVSSILDFFV